MIIGCNNCNKKFDIDSSLIPEKGRLLQCSSCDHQWFFKRDVDQTIQIPSNTNITNYNDEEVLISKNKIKGQKNKEDEIKNLNNEINIKKNKKKFRVLNLTIVFIISFLAFVILIDTFKHPISKIVPNIEFILYNLYESIKDIKLFFNDLI